MGMGGATLVVLRAISLLLDPTTRRASQQGGHSLLPHTVALQSATCSGGGVCGR